MSSVSHFFHPPTDVSLWEIWYFRLLRPWNEVNTRCDMQTWAWREPRDHRPCDTRPCFHGGHLRYLMKMAHLFRPLVDLIPANTCEFTPKRYVYLIFDRPNHEADLRNSSCETPKYLQPPWEERGTQCRSSPIRQSNNPQRLYSTKRHRPIPKGQEGTVRSHYSVPHPFGTHTHLGQPPLFCDFLRHRLFKCKLILMITFSCISATYKTFFLYP